MNKHESCRRDICWMTGVSMVEIEKRNERLKLFREGDHEDAEQGSSQDNESRCIRQCHTCQHIGEQRQQHPEQAGEESARRQQGGKGRNSQQSEGHNQSEERSNSAHADSCLK